MSPTHGSRPKVSVVIPTYNRAELLRDTLRQLVRQTLPADEFEVIVSDDGSSDETEAVARSFSDRLRLGYHFQEDLGFRAGAARNAGAAMAAAPLLVFLDTAAMAGPDFLRSHLAEHGGGAPHRVVVGYAHGYNPDYPMAGVGGLLERMNPEEVLARFRDDPAFLDIRHEQFAACGFDLQRRAVPWNMLFTINCSVLAEDFRAVGGFDEEFRGWGGEDLELGFRLFRHGLSYRMARDAWVIESSHERDMTASLREFMVNMRLFLRKHPEPVIELGWALLGDNLPFFDWSEEYRQLGLWADKSRDLAVADEIAEAVRGVPAGERVAVFGAGAVIPASVPPLVAVDFDRTLLDRALADGRHVGHHSVGLRTPLADQCVDTVVITSRLSGLWERWESYLMAEAHRVGRTVVRAFAEA